MSKLKKQSTQSVNQSDTGFPLRLAIATATLGMTMGVSLSDVLAAPRQLDLRDKQIATEYIKIDGVQRPAVTQAKPVPAVSHTKAEHPGKVFPKMERPHKAYPKVEVQRALRNGVKR